VFNVPPRAVLEAAPYAAANQLSKEQYGRGISRQSYALRGKILEVDSIARRDERLFEVHPEVTFAAMAGRTLHYKKTWVGTSERRRLIRLAGIEIPDDLGGAGVVPVDDILDAAAVAWTADRIAQGVAEAIPAEPEYDGKLRMAIWI
jgi:predicted RNase H-like nuclease